MDLSNCDYLYKESFFGKRYKLNWRAPIMVEMITEVFYPQRVVDVGCGIGDIVYELNEHNIPSIGIEGTINCLPHACDKNQILVHDIRTPLAGRIHLDPFDLALCFEVAEHIEETAVDMFIYNLTYLSDQILMSIAGPGQKGHGHWTLKEIEWWESLFNQYRYFRNKGVEEKVRKYLEPYRHKDGIRAYYNNLFYVERRIRP